MDVAVVHVELVGKGPLPHITEIAVIVLDGKALWEKESYSTLLQTPRGLITPENIATNGITPEMTSSGPSFLDIADRVYDLLNGKTWIAYDAGVLAKAIGHAFSSCSRTAPIAGGMVDASAWVRAQLPQSPESLSHLAPFFGVPLERRRASDQCRFILTLLSRLATSLLLTQISQPPIVAAPVVVAPVVAAPAPAPASETVSSPPPTASSNVSTPSSNTSLSSNKLDKASRIYARPVDLSSAPPQPAPEPAVASVVITTPAPVWSPSEDNVSPHAALVATAISSSKVVQVTMKDGTVLRARPTLLADDKQSFVLQDSRRLEMTQVQAVVVSEEKAVVEINKKHNNSNNNNNNNNKKNPKRQNSSSNNSNNAANKGKVAIVQKKNSSAPPEAQAEKAKESPAAAAPPAASSIVVATNATPIVDDSKKTVDKKVEVKAPEKKSADGVEKKVEVKTPEKKTADGERKSPKVRSGNRNRASPNVTKVYRHAQQQQPQQQSRR